MGLPMNMDFTKVDGWVDLAGFTSMSAVLFLNTFALYVMVHQLFYTYRLMTSGPTGFEIAASFYLNPSLTQYRHLAIHSLMRSLPLFVLGSGIKIALMCWKDALPSAQEPQPS